MSKKKQKNKSLGLAFIFIFCICALLIVAVLLKGYLLFKNSQYNSNFNYNIEVKSRKETQYLSLSPKKGSVTIISSGEIPSSILIPVDLSIESEDDLNKDNIKDSLPALLLGSSKLNIFDVAKIKFFLSPLSGESIAEENIDFEAEENEQRISEIFEEPLILNEKQSIGIINSTGRAGAGAKLAKTIGFMGGNVILVSTSADESKVSKIETKVKNGYTVSRLSGYLELKPEYKTDGGIADITIVIGKDLIPDLRL